ncbi:NUDIX hydrolase [Paenibacillus mendelii]|uniref:NUDIX domain-containing protein n=1 Tax=Paenibacillus mendelii TaxID=206163 RepID=A0ABV6J5J6_9BACL|nr:8-oxo-dGTP diphosphatase [Paenibacillus mendelii]MCQ6559295.1 8-oxo-dGTP diphosphatase [Paenibacillus mendelii]
MITYTICFIRQGNHVLLLNRESPSWMGCWNGVGGKIERDETPRQSMIREIVEETLLSETEYQLNYRGLVSWTVDHQQFGGMVLYSADISEDAHYSTPVKTVEGILDWKSMDWVMHPKNQGLATSIPLIMNYLNEEAPYHHHCSYLEGKLADTSSEAITDATENLQQMNEYIKLFKERTAGGKQIQPLY